MYHFETKNSEKMNTVYVKAASLLTLSFNFCCFVESYPVSVSLQNIVKLNWDAHFHPKTLRVIIHELNDPPLKFNWQWISEYVILSGNNRPLQTSPDPRSVSTGRMTGKMEVFHYIVLVWITDPAIISELLQNIRATVNERWDRIILLATTDILSTVMHDSALKAMKIRFGIDILTGEIWTDPFSFYQDGALVKFKDRPMYKRVDALRGRHLVLAGGNDLPWVYQYNENGRNGMMK